MIIFTSRCLFKLALTSGKVGWDITKKSVFLAKKFTQNGAQLASNYYNKITLFRKIYMFHKYNQGNLIDLMNTDTSAEASVLAGVYLLVFRLF